jgi:hypothetical protein
MLEFVEHLLPFDDDFEELEKLCGAIGLEKSNLKENLISNIKNSVHSNQEKLVYLYSGNGSSFRLQLIGLIQRQIFELEIFNKRLISYEEDMETRERENRMHTRNRASWQAFYSYKTAFLEFEYSTVLTAIGQLGSSSGSVKSTKRLVSLCENIRRESEMNRWYECYCLIEQFKSKTK